MKVCEHCEYRDGYECADGWNRCKGGCGEFWLDWSTLTDKQKKIIRDNLMREEESECY